MALICNAIWTVKPGSEEVVREALEGLCPAARAEPGELGGEPSGQHGLAEAVALANSGRFRIPIQFTMQMALAAEAHAAAEHGPRQGKIALTAPSLDAQK